MPGLQFWISTKLGPASGHTGLSDGLPDGLPNGLPGELSGVWGPGV